MNKPQFLSRLISQPWNIDKMRARSIIGNIIARLRGERPGEDKWGEPLPKMQIIGNVAVIPLTGVVSLDVPEWIKEYGLYLTDANDIAEELEEAVNDANVELIVYDCDSPGGLSLAGDKLFEATAAANRKKPVGFHVADGRECCSTAYEAVASCTAGYAGRFALAVGCIGSYLVLLDDTEFWAQMGISFEVFRSGELKAIGEDKLTEAQRSFLQSLSDQAGARFRKNVSQYRTSIAREDMEGQWFDGLAAAQRGFVAGTVKDLNAAIAKFRRLAG